MPGHLSQHGSLKKRLILTCQRILAPVLLSEKLIQILARKILKITRQRLHFVHQALTFVSIGISGKFAHGIRQVSGQARQGFGEVAASQSLSEGRGDVATQQEMIQAKLGGDAQAQQKVARATMGKLAAFQGGGEALQTQKGAVGLGSAATR